MRSNQVFRGETTLPVGVELPKASTHLKMLEKLQELFPEIVALMTDGDTNAALNDLSDGWSIA